MLILILCLNPDSWGVVPDGRLCHCGADKDSVPGGQRGHRQDAVSTGRIPGLPRRRHSKQPACASTSDPPATANAPPRRPPSPPPCSTPPPVPSPPSPHAPTSRSTPGTRTTTPASCPTPSTPSQTSSSRWTSATPAPAPASSAAAPPSSAAPTPPGSQAPAPTASAAPPPTPPCTSETSKCQRPGCQRACCPPRRSYSTRPARLGAHALAFVPASCAHARPHPRGPSPWQSTLPLPSEDSSPAPRHAHPRHRGQSHRPGSSTEGSSRKWQGLQWTYSIQSHNSLHTWFLMMHAMKKKKRTTP